MHKKNGLSEAMVDRLRLTHERIDAMAKGLRQLIDLPDPVELLLKKRNDPMGSKSKSKNTHWSNWYYL